MTVFVLRHEGKWGTVVANTTGHAAIFQGKRHKVTFRDVLKGLGKLS
jgi:hypothetical protein